jgi:hypothetical protein
VKHALLIHLDQPVLGNKRHALVPVAVLTDLDDVRAAMGAAYRSHLPHPVLIAAAAANIHLQVGAVYRSPTAAEWECLRRRAPVMMCKLCQQERRMARQDNNLERLLARSIRRVEQQRKSTT